MLSKNARATETAVYGWPNGVIGNPNPRIGLGSVLIDQITGPGPLQETGI